MDSATTDQEATGSSSEEVTLLPVEGNLKNLLWILGYAFFWSWFMITMFGNTVLLPLSPSLMIEPLFRAVALGAMIVAFAVLLLLSLKLDPRTHTKYLLAIALACSPWVAIVYLVQPVGDEGALWLIGGCWALFGISSALLIWANLLHISILDTRSIRSVLGISATLGGIIYLLVSQLPSAVGLAFVIALPICAVICIGSAKPQNPTPHDNVLHGSPYAGRPLANAMNALRASFRYQPDQPFFGILCGLAIGTGISTYIMETHSFPFELGICLCLSGPVLLVFACMPKMVPVETITWFLMPVAAFGILPIMLGVQAITLICCALLAFCYTFYALVHALALNELMHENPSYRNEIVSSGMILMYGGVLIGWCTSFAFFALNAYESLGFYSTLMAIALIMVIAIAVIGRPSKRSPDALIMKETPEDSQQLWEEACKDIAEQSKLSPRQTEIFMYLAKGRNAPYIEEKLVVSYHTVKAHIYRIYQKLDVHSQQELINVVEEHMNRS